MHYAPRGLNDFPRDDTKGISREPSPKSPKFPQLCAKFLFQVLKREIKEKVKVKVWEVHLSGRYLRKKKFVAKEEIRR